MIYTKLLDILVDKLTDGFICIVKYKDGNSVLSKPYKNILDLTSEKIILTNYVINESESINISNIIGITIHHIDVIESNNLVDKLIESNYDKKLTFIYGKDIMFNERCLYDKNILKVLNLIKSINIDDYDKLLTSDYDMISILKLKIKEEILIRYNETLNSIDEEIESTTDQSIKDELSSIKTILMDIPNEIDFNLTNKILYKDIISYWPTLLLPKSPSCNIS